jgi:hypothetical protein
VNANTDDAFFGNTPGTVTIGAPVTARSLWFDVDGLGDRYVLMLSIVLAGYALLGRAFAYIGLAPMFVGEATLLFGMLTLLSTPRWVRMFRTSQAMLLLPFMAWGFMRTLPYIGQYQLDAARDAVLWGYSIFAFYSAAVILADNSRLDRLLRWYDKFSRIFLVCIPFIWAIAHFLGDSVPRWPWIDQNIIQIKEGDVLVHLAGIIAFWASGLGPAVSWRWIVLLTFDLTICGVIDRGGLISFLFVLGVCFCLRPRSVAPWRLISMIAVGLLILAVTGIDIAVPGGKDRTISFSQLVENVFSVGKTSKAAGLDATKEWRMNWWSDIYNYTVNGKYFWGGKGYGINLADDDGYQVGDGTLRTPHNVHMTILARGGVMGLGLWVLVHVVWLFGIGWGHLTARRRGSMRWASMFLWMGCFYCAFLINGSFDVFLEGPMGGIWFWTLYGVGVACLWMYKHEPAELHY